MRTTHRFLFVVRRFVRYLERTDSSQRKLPAFALVIAPVNNALEAALECAIAGDGEPIFLTHVANAERALKKLEARERAEVVRRAFLPRVVT